MRQKCPKCGAKTENTKKTGSYVRKSDSKKVQRFQCKLCKKSFSKATFSACVYQNKRRLNSKIQNLLCSNVSQRRIAKICKTTRSTVARKKKFLAEQARKKKESWLLKQKKFTELQFDDLETFEHTKCKPISVCLFVDKKTRKIVDFEAYSIPAKGLLAKISVKKYGKRQNDGVKAKELLFTRVSKLCTKEVKLSSDQSTLYTESIKQHFPEAEHKAYKGRRGCVTGQGELKKGGHDPLFSINHTFAMLRANMSRLIRKTWCTTKKIECLRDHIDIYAQYHNQVLTN